MATELGQAYVQIMPSAKGISANIEKELNGGAPGAKKSGGKMGGALKVGLIAAVAGIGAVVGKAIFEGGALEQSLGGVETLFKDNADIVISNAEKAYKTAGLSANAYMETVTGFSASLLQSTGGDTVEAARIADVAVTDMSDNANKFGTSMESIQYAYQGFAKQNYTMLDNLKLGYGGTKEEMKRLLKDAEAISGVKYDLNQLDDVYQAVHVIQNELGVTGTTALEAAETFQGSMSSMKSSWQNVLGQMATGQDATAAMSQLSESVVTFANNLMPMVTSVLTQLPTLIVTLLTEAGPQLMETGAKAISELLNGLAAALPTLMPVAVDAIMTIASTLIDNLPEIVDAAIALISGLAQGLIDSMPIIMEKIPIIIDSLVAALMELLPIIVDAGIDLFTSLVDALPEIIDAIVAVLPDIIQSIVDALLESLPTLVQAGVDLFVALVGAMPEIIETIVGALPQIIESVVSAVIGSLPEIIQAGLELFVALVAALPEIITTVVGAIPEIITGIVDAIVESWPKIKQAGKDLLNGLADGIGDAIGGVVKKAKEAAAKIVGTVKDFFGIRSPSKVFYGFGEQLDAGLAKGITGNMKPISKAMDEMGALTTRSFESDIAMNASSMGSSQLQSAAMASQSSTAYNIYLNNMPASDSDKRKLAQYIEEERRRGLMARGAMA